MLRLFLLYLNPLVALFVFFRLAWPAFHWPMRMVVAVLLVPGALCSAVLRWFGGSVVAPELPPTLLMIGYYGQILVLLLAVFVVLRELVSLVLWAGRWQPFSRLSRSRKLAGGILACAMLLVGYGEYCALRLPQVDRVEIQVPGLPQGLEGMTIAQLSDLHVSELFRAGRVQRIVQTVNELKPDMVAITGDWVDGTVANRSGDLLPIKLLRAPLGIWGVEGNHEHYVDYWGWRHFLPTLNVHMLFNQSGLVARNGTIFYMVGLTDPQAIRSGDEPPNLPKALEDVPADAFKILLMHQPKDAVEMCRAGFGLQLSGHTHGAQIRFLQPIVASGNGGYVIGSYDVHCGSHVMKLYVNQGTDLWNGFPLRWGTHGEITLITLTGLPASGK